jgi:hypothetical protein
MRAFSFLVIALLAFTSCKKVVEEEVNYDYPIYGINTQVLYSSSAEKTRQKTPVQYISILYGDLFGARIPNNVLNNLTLLSTAIGDKGMANELILSHYLNNPTLQLPTNAEMQSNPEMFAEQTYIRFYKRRPTPYEKIFLVNLIEDDAALTVEVIYTAFVLSNEYYFY